MLIITISSIHYIYLHKTSFKNNFTLWKIQCTKILNDNNENSTVSFVLGLLNFTGIPHSATSAFSPKPNFLDHDVEKSNLSRHLAAQLTLNF